MNNKKLFRSTTNRMVCGVCGGLGDFFGIDATVIRVLYVVVSLILGAGFLGLILYFILAEIIPEDDGIVDERREEASCFVKSNRRRSRITPSS